MFVVRLVIATKDFKFINFKSLRIHPNFHGPTSIFPLHQEGKDYCLLVVGILFQDFQKIEQKNNHQTQI